MLPHLYSTEMLEALFPDRLVRNTITRVDNPATMARTGDRGSNHYRVRDEAGTCIFERHGSICFGDLTSWLGRYEEDEEDEEEHQPNRSQILEYQLPRTQLSRRELLRWFQLAQEVGAFTDEIEDTMSPQAMLASGWCRIDLRQPTLSISQLYLTLCFLRWTREGAGLIADTLRLVDDAGRDFWSALSFCHFRARGQAAGQGLLPISGTYATGNSRRGSYRDLWLLRNIADIARSAGACDNRLVAECISGQTWPAWNWFARCHPGNDLPLLSNRFCLLSDAITPVKLARTDAAALNAVQHLGPGNTEFAAATGGLELFGLEEPTA